MKFFKYIILLLFFSCSNITSGVDKVYICGDHPCINNKEAKDYFDNNISIEVYTISTDKAKKENFDLVELNLLKDQLKTKEKIEVSDKKKQIKDKIKERKKIAKLKINELDNSKKTLNKVNKKESKINKEANKITFVRICKNLEECDIDKISKIIMDIGKKKDYPDITN